MKQIDFLTGAFKTGSGILVLLILALGGAAQVCTNPSNVIYGLTNTGEVRSMTVSTGAVGARMNAAYPGQPANLSNGIGYNVQNGKFYYFKRSPDLAPQEFVSWNPITNTYQALRACPTLSSINVGCVTNDGKGFYCWDQDGVLYYYDITTNNWATISSNLRDQAGHNVSAIIQANVSGDVAVDGAGTLIFLVGGNTQFALYKLSNPPKTAMASVTLTEMMPVTNSPGGVKFVGIALNVTGEILLATSANPTAMLYRLEDDLTFTFLKNLTLGVGDITSCNFPLSILPVSLKNLSANEKEGNVLVSWEDRGRQGVNGYFVEHSMNGSDWSKLGFVKASNNGEYTFRHMASVKGRNYYRIKIENATKSEDYSSVKVVNLEARAALAVWPNPVENKMVVQYEGGKGVSGNMFLLDQSGRIIRQQILAAGMNTVDVTGLSAGSYFIRVQDASGKNYVNKIVKN